MLLLLDLALIPKAHKPATDQGLETQMQPSHEQSTPSINEITGSNTA